MSKHKHKNTTYLCVLVQGNNKIVFMEDPENILLSYLLTVSYFVHWNFYQYEIYEMILYSQFIFNTNPLGLGLEPYSEHNLCNLITFKKEG